MKSTFRIWQIAGLLLSTGIFLLLIAFLIGEGMFGESPIIISNLTPVEIIEFVAVFIMMAGTLVAWRWMLVGSWIMIGGSILFIFIESLSDIQLSWGGIHTPIYLIAGLLLLLAHCQRHHLTD